MGTIKKFMIKQLHYLLFIYSIINEHGEIQQTYKKKIFFYINIKRYRSLTGMDPKKKQEREREYKQCRIAILPSGVLSLLLMFCSFCCSRREWKLRGFGKLRESESRRKREMMKWLLYEQWGFFFFFFNYLFYYIVVLKIN